MSEPWLKRVQQSMPDLESENSIAYCGSQAVALILPKRRVALLRPSHKSPTARGGLRTPLMPGRESHRLYIERDPSATP